MTLLYICDIIKERTDSIENSECITRDYVSVTFGDESYRVYTDSLSSASVTVGFEADNYSGSTPTLYVDNQPVKRWKSCSSRRGTRINMGISVYSSGQFFSYEKEILSGSSHAITMDMQAISGQDIMTAYYKLPVTEEAQSLVSTGNLLEDKYMGNFLDIIGRMYFAQLDVESKMIANAQNIYSERYISVGVFSFTPTFTERYGQITEHASGNYSVDIIGNNYAAVSLEGNSDDEINYYFTSGYISSYLEHLVLEQFVGIDSISTAKVFQISQEQGIGLKTICSANADEISNLNLSSSDIAEIRAYVNNGYTVIVPEKNITVNDWTGTGYIVQSQSSREIIFRLTGGLCGGLTTSDVSLYYALMAIFTIVDMYSIMYQFTMVAATLICTGNIILGAAILAVEFALLLVIADTFDETVKLYTNALLGNTAADNELYYSTMINSLFRIAGMILAPVLEPIGGMIAKNKLVQKIGGAVDDVIWEGNNKILATSEKYRNLVLAGFDEGDVGGLFSNPNCFLYADDVIEEMLKSGNAKGVMDSLADCGDDVIRAINGSSNKGAVVEQVSKFGDDIVNVINGSANKEAAVALISEFGDDGVKVVMSCSDETVDYLAKTNSTNVKLIDIRGAKNSELDEVDFANKIIYEDKYADGLFMEEPDEPLSPSQWAEKHIWKKGKNRLDALSQDKYRLLVDKKEPVDFMKEDICSIKNYVFRIHADTPELRTAVDSCIEDLKKKYPKYEISVIYGYGG